MSGYQPAWQQNPYYGQQGQAPEAPPAAPQGQYMAPQMAMTGAKKPNSWLALSIITLFFFLVLGVIAIVYSVQVNSRWNAGDAEGAQRASKTALILSIVGLVVGGIFTVLWLVILANA